MDMCQKAAKTGASFITVHGRTKDQRCQPVNLEAIRAIKDAVDVPVVANGDIRSLEDSIRVQEETGVDGELHFLLLLPTLCKVATL